MPIKIKRIPKKFFQEIFSSKKMVENKTIIAPLVAVIGEAIEARV
jgi:hypothetical protein